MSQSLAILHCLRAPVGGLFRHVRDVATEQAKRGHRVGVLVDSNTSDSLTESRLADLADQLELGLHRTAIGRNPGLRDVAAIARTKKLAEKLSLDVLHGHGAKGGAIARLAGRSLKRGRTPVKTFYTPHGGSLHYGPRSVKGMVFLTLERALISATDGLIFECNFARTVYENHIGKDLAPTRVIHNGLHPSEFAPVTRDPKTADQSADFVFIGELRELKGIDVLLKALAALPSESNVHCAIVGDGPDADRFKVLARDLGLADRTRFLGAMPAREAFSLGNVLVMSSRKESFPYIVLEAGAAAVPMITTNVGGIPEIMQGTGALMINPDDVPILAQAMTVAMQDPDGSRQRADELREVIYQRFTVAGMTDEILDFYDESRRA